MQANNISTLSDFLGGWQNNQQYFNSLQMLAQLSRLFSDNDVPYLDYRLAENIFCRYFSAQNDARSCTAYDARINQIGIGIKTFILNERDSSVEKIAEFNKLKPKLDPLSGIDLAYQIGVFRNERMQFANDTYSVSECQYHIVGRKQNLLRIFNSPYEMVDIDNISNVNDTTKSISFTDGQNEYFFNKSKSVLQKRFVVPSIYVDIEIAILQDPLQLLEDFFNEQKTVLAESIPLQKGVDYVVLPLYSVRHQNVPERSGLNQWNAHGRTRHENEVYVSVPIEIHNNYPNFFPSRDYPFQLNLPDGKILQAKICQENGKALMSNPNKDLGEWLLRKVLKKNVGELVTMDDLNRIGIDSVCVEDTHSVNGDGLKIYKLSFSDNYESYSKFF